MRVGTAFVDKPDDELGPGKLFMIENPNDEGGKSTFEAFMLFNTELDDQGQLEGLVLEKAGSEEGAYVISNTKLDEHGGITELTIQKLVDESSPDPIAPEAGNEN